jgi:hypothetical protein
MKKLFTLFACASLAFTLSAQDSGQAAGSWYLGSGDATSLLNIFTSGVEISSTVGYAVVDDFVVTAQAGFGGTFDNLDLSLGAAYFIGDYYVGVDLDNPINDLDLGINAGRYIDFKDVLYLTPQININTLLNDPEVSFTIGFGARF